MYVKNGRITKSASHIMNTSYGDKQVLTVTTDDGNEVKIWFAPHKQPHASLPVGQEVQVEFIQNKYGTVSKKLVVDQNGMGYPAQQQAPIQQQPIQQYSAPKKKEVTEEDIKTYIGGSVDLLQECLDQVTDMLAKQIVHQYAVQDVNDTYALSEVSDGELEAGNEKITKYKYYKSFTSEDVRAMAISLYIATQRKFSL